MLIDKQNTHVHVGNFLSRFQWLITFNNKVLYYKISLCYISFCGNKSMLYEVFIIILLLPYYEILRCLQTMFIRRQAWLALLDACPTGDQEFMGLTPTGLTYSFVQI